MKHYHIFKGHGEPVVTAWFMYGKDQLIGYAARQTANDTAKVIAKGKPVSIRQCTHEACTVLKGAEDRG